MLRSKFRGALVGTLVGDCLGAYWESRSWKGAHCLEEVKHKMEEQLKETSSQKAPPIGYTGDVVLTLALGESIMDCGKFDVRHFAQKISEVYYDDPGRGYGRAVALIFYKLKTSKYSDIFAPAKEQFDGQGSCGNGSAMRISPAALLGLKSDQCLIYVCIESSKVTHSHLSGINNSILQAAAIKVALETEVGELNPIKFVDRLSDFMQPHEPSYLFGEIQDNRKCTQACSQPLKVKMNYIEGQPTCLSKLQQVRTLLLEKETPSANYVQEVLGHGILAAEAVPCAIYAFLSHVNKSFEEMVPFAISLGGDTDTIAGMAGAIAGAYFGFDSIPKDWIECCEDVSRMTSLADSLYELVEMS